MIFISILLFLSSHVYIVSGTFCFSACGKCTDITYDSCKTNCQPGASFTNSTNLTVFTCVKTPYNYYSQGAKYQPVGLSSDIPVEYKIGTSINISLETLGIDTYLRTVCVDDGTGNNSLTYQYFGNMFGNQVFYFNHSGVTGFNYNVNYYMVRVIYGFITFGGWNGTQKIITTFITNTTSSPYSDLLSTNNVSNVLCSDPQKNSTYRTIVRDFRWNYNLDPTQSTDPLQFEITTDVTDPTKKWGIMNVIVSVRLCHPYCLTCTGDSNVGSCIQCNYENQQIKKSGNTCDVVCASGYGDDNSDHLVCITCQPLCKYCFQYPQYCRNCISPRLLFKNSDFNYSCVTACPEHYYANTTGNDTCMICDSSCLNCTSISTKCTACYNGTYLYNFTCVNPCPAQYYGDDPTLTCKACNKYCYTCALTSTNCSVCDTTGPWISYLLSPNTCTTNCGNGFYADTNNGLGPNLCLPCDTKCLTCVINATFCLSCPANSYLIDNICLSTCPSDYFSDNSTWKCLSCAQYCVNMTMNLYWENSLHEDLVCDLTFSQDLSWGPSDIQRFLQVSVDDPLINIDSFNLVYTVVAPNIMRLTLSPKGYAFIYNSTFNFKTIALKNENYDYSVLMHRFSDFNYDVSESITWFLIIAPSLSGFQKKIMEGVSDVSTKMLQVSTMPYVQQVKKTGVFAMLMGGIQITSTACLVNSIPSQNFYEGIRFWASFVMFDVPNWQENSKYSKNIIGPKAQDLIQNARLLQTDHININNRILFDTSVIDWRFERTGYTTFFIYDTYINLSLIVLCWILLVIAHCLIKNKQKQSKILGYFYSFTLKVHEISIFYISISTMLQWIYFDAASFQRWMSFGTCIFFNLYFLAYQLYIYYDMINYPVAAIGNKKYDYYAIKYGSLLKNIKFIEYDVIFLLIQPHEQWSVKHWFRPYNYEILSFYKTFLMMISLPIFYSFKNAQISVLLIIQFFEILRFIIIWPYKSKVRNIIKLGLQFFLLMFFMSIIIQSIQISEIQLNNPDTLEKAIQIFYKIGWFGFAVCWIYNIGNIAFFIYDLIIGFLKTNRQMMDESRKIYYMEKIKSYEDQNQDVPLAMVNKWVKLGNLNQRNFDNLTHINLKVEFLKIRKSRNGFQIQIKKIFQVFMKKQIDYHKQNNLSTSKKIHQHFTLTKSFYPIFYEIIQDIYNEFMAMFNFEYFTINTFQKIVQSDYKPGEKIILDEKIMTQKVDFFFIDGSKKTIWLEELLLGFPLKEDHLKGLM